MLRLLTGRNRALGPALLREVGDASTWSCPSS